MSASDTTPGPSETSLDRHFIVAAIAVGASYAVILAILGYLMGKEAAGVAGAVLTTIATTLFTKFQSLRIARANEERVVTVQVPRFAFWPFSVMVIVMYGMPLFIGRVLVPILALIFFIIPPVGDWLAYTHMFSADYFEFGSPWNALFYLVSGYVIARSRPPISLLYVPLATLFTIFMFLVGDAYTIIHSASRVSEIAQQATFWLLFVFAAMAGAWIGKGKGVTKVAGPN